MVRKKVRLLFLKVSRGRISGNDRDPGALVPGKRRRDDGGSSSAGVDSQAFSTAKENKRARVIKYPPAVPSHFDDEELEDYAPVFKAGASGKNLRDELIQNAYSVLGEMHGAAATSLCHVLVFEPLSGLAIVRIERDFHNDWRKVISKLERCCGQRIQCTIVRVAGSEAQLHRALRCLRDGPDAYWRKTIPRQRWDMLVN